MLTLHLVSGHSLDVSEGLLGGGHQLGPPLPDPPLVVSLLVEPLVVAQLPLAHTVDGGAHSARDLQ